ncbi:hypothetical protein V8E51_014341 [Hyaloscypha variabilis]
MVHRTVGRPPSSRPVPAQPNSNRSRRSRRLFERRRCPGRQVPEPEVPGSPPKKQRKSYDMASLGDTHDDDRLPSADVTTSPSSQTNISSPRTFGPTIESEASDSPADRPVRDVSAAPGSQDNISPPWSVEPSLGSEASRSPTDDRSFRPVSISPSYPHDADGYPLPGVRLTPRYQRSDYSSSPDSPPPKRPSPDSDNPERPGDPNKRQRKTLETQSPVYEGQEEDWKMMEGEDLTPLNNYSPDCSSASIEKNWEGKWTAQSKERARHPFNLTTTFERLSPWKGGVGETIMRSLSVVQEYHRKDCNASANPIFRANANLQKPVSENAWEVWKARSKKLLTKDWEKNLETMMRWVEGGLVCRNCNNRHKIHQFEVKIEEMKMELQKMDPYTIDQAMLDRFQENARKIGEDYLLQVKGTDCVGPIDVRHIAKKKQSQSQSEIQDSGVGLTACKLAKLDIKAKEMCID